MQALTFLEFQFVRDLFVLLIVFYDPIESRTNRDKTNLMPDELRLKDFNETD